MYNEDVAVFIKNKARHKGLNDTNDARSVNEDRKFVLGEPCL